jgi:predicted transcriptional regulator
MKTHVTCPTGVKLESTIKLRLEKLGKLKNRTVHWLMKEAISSYIEREEKAEKLKQETISRWREAELQEVVSNKAVVKWLDTWGANNEKGRPVCGK